MTKKVREMRKANAIQMQALATFTYMVDIQDIKLRYELGELSKKEALARLHAAEQATDDSLKLISLKS